MGVKEVLLTVSVLMPNVLAQGTLWATHYSGTVSTLQFSQTGTSYSLTSSSQTTCGFQPSWLTYDSATKILYCVDESNFGGTLSSYNAGSAGALSQTAKITIPNNGVHSTLYGGANGDGYLAIAHYQTSQFSTFALPITSSSKALQTFKFTMSAVGPIPSRQEAPHPHMALLDPTGTFILIPDLGADIIRIYSIATSTGLLTSCANYTAAAGTGPRHGSFFVPTAGTTAGTVLYIGNELSNSISAFSVSYTGSCLSLSLSQNAAPYPGGKVPAATTPNGVKVGEVRVVGSTLLTSNRADNSFGSNLDSIARFDLDATGKFAFGNLTSTFGSYPRTFAVSKKGDFVAIGNQNSATVAIVKRDPATGLLGDLAAKATIGVTGTDGNGGLSSVIWME